MHILLWVWEHKYETSHTQSSVSYQNRFNISSGERTVKKWTKSQNGRALPLIAKPQRWLQPWISLSAGNSRVLSTGCNGWWPGHTAQIARPTWLPSWAVKPLWVPSLLPACTAWDGHPQCCGFSFHVTQTSREEADAQRMRCFTWFTTVQQSASYLLWLMKTLQHWTDHFSQRQTSSSWHIQTPFPIHPYRVINFSSTSK